MGDARILVVEDHPETCRTIQLYMEHNGYHCQVCHRGLDGVRLMQDDPFDLVVLDVMLPDMDGFEVCRRMRTHSAAPIIMLTARVEEQDLVKGLGSGADDYVRKPYSNKELVARVEAHLRRVGGAQRKQGPYRIDAAARQIHVADTPLALTRMEYAVLLAMLQSPGRVFSREQLTALCQEQDALQSDRTVDVHIHNLRKKVVAAGQDKHGITAVYGVGYKWVCP